jgi:membrane protease YdiL (CAAX protease family)
MQEETPPTPGATGWLSTPAGRYVRRLLLLGAGVAAYFFVARWMGNLAWRTFPEALRRVDASGLPYAVPWLVAGLVGLAVAPDTFRVPWRWHVRDDRNGGPSPGAEIGTRIATVWGDVAAWAIVLLGTGYLYRHALAAILAHGVRLPSPGLGLLGAAVAWPVAEEWLFRGVLWRELGGGDPRRRWGCVLALVVTSIAFGLWHLPHSPSPIWIHAAFGALMGLLRWRTGSVLPPTIVHGAGNALRYFAAW